MTLAANQNLKKAFSAREILKCSFFRILFSFVFFLFLLPGNLVVAGQGQHTQQAAEPTKTWKPLPKRVVRAQRVNPHPPQVDGQLDDEAWSHGEWQNDFVQFDPYEGQPPSEQTAFKVLYDDSHVYVGIRCYDSQPQTIEKRLGRRDNSPGDAVEVFFDSLADQRTSFCFAVNAAGVKTDQLAFNDNYHDEQNDLSWDPIWEVKTAVDELGWVAEMKIPFSQLRFGNKDQQVWGFEVLRLLFRKNEISLWQPIPKNAPGWASQFGELRGIDGIKPPRQVEMVPYAVGKWRRYPPEAGNPFTPGREKSLFGGLDGKVGLTHDLTLNFTFNPDFGQVEADPSVINLTAYEVYFEEKRPFFVEGKNITDFKITGGDGDFSYDNLFYTRRIGRAPQIYPATAGYCSLPQSTTILGAFKLSGKTRTGWSIGMMEALTSKEKASIYDPASGKYGSPTAEPLTNYMAFRLQKDYRQGATYFGTMVTAVNRQLEGLETDILPRAVYTGGLDFFHSWKNRQYYFSFKLVGSSVYGKEQAIDRLQRSSVHYYQRPDADYLSYDPKRVFLQGHGGSVDFGRMGGSNLMFSTGLTWRSPGLELNDMGFLRSADVAMQYVWMGYRFTKPFGIFRNLSLNFNQWSGWNFGGERIFGGGNVNGWAQFKNYWSLSLGINRQGSGLSPSALRGGPLLKVAPAWNVWSFIQTDMRKKLRLAVQGQWRRADNDDNLSYFLGPQLNFVPHPAFNLSLQPTYSVFKNELQYVKTIAANGKNRYLVGRVDQATLSLTLRFNLSLTPDLSVQFYGMPFISAGKYSRFKAITEPRTKEWRQRYFLFGDKEIRYEANRREYDVDEEGDGKVDYSFGNPNFNFRQFRSNLVLRWEYRPGCTLFLVWSQGRTGYGANGIMNWSEDLKALFTTGPDDVFLVKFSYCFDL